MKIKVLKVICRNTCKRDYSKEKIMAHVRFDLTKALNRESYAYNCWVNKNYEDNTLAITDEEMKQIEDHWGNQCVNDWKIEAENDHTEYEIDDEDFDLAALESQEETKAEVEEVTGAGSPCGKCKRLIESIIELKR